MLSIAWGPPVPRLRQQKEKEESDSSDEEEEDDWTDSWLVTGGSDSSLRKWDIKTGRVVERMGVDKIRGERTLVWTVGVLGYVLESSVEFKLTLCQRWDDNIRGLTRKCQILGLKDVYAITHLQRARRRCSLHGHQPCTCFPVNK